MHPNPIYRQTEAERSLEFALAAGFGQIMVSADPVPLWHIFRSFRDNRETR